MVILGLVRWIIFSIFYQTAQVYSTFILIQLIGSVIALACAIFQTDLVIRDVNFSLAELMFSIAISGSNLFLYCYYGKLSTDYYGGFAGCLYESNWMLLPVDLQKSFISMIVYARKPLSYHGYNFIDLNLDTFTMVSNQ